jgi:hypothetical protein
MPRPDSPALVTSDCKHCGRPFSYRRGKRGPPKKHCSDKCRNRAGHRLIEQTCNRCGENFSARSIYGCCSRACAHLHRRRPDLAKTCAQCGVAYSSKDPKRKFCGAKCAIAWSFASKTSHVCEVCGVTFPHKNGRRADRCCSRACGFELMRRERGQEALQRRRADGKFSPVHFRACATCGRIKCSGRNTVPRACEGECSRQLACKRARTAGIRRYRSGPPRTCKECEAVFTPQYADKKRTFCSTKCATKYAGRIGKATRRGRERNGFAESFNPIEILRRDGWRCYLCGVETPRSLRGSIDDRAPEMDHIIALADGGPHRRSNVACACRKCNNAKEQNPGAGKYKQPHFWEILFPDDQTLPTPWSARSQPWVFDRPPPTRSAGSA